ncbi:TetR/AcrR family transcriptional regulator [Symbioplanes lichenis]|uniref:TetR/AcrR family transcriptional regulator n=1 Tax=Symbioplanes lichenis TaxID=1629072 RepID=UPI002738EDDC|nr:TetR family transcriptional regulator [Actinoplanes lichenis]
MERATYHHGDLAAALLAAGLELLEAEGADRLSLRALARAAGVSPNAPYRHYADKEDLLAALAAHGYADVRARLAGVTGDTVRDRLVATVQEGVRFALARPQVFRLMAGHICSTHPAVRTAMAELQATVGRTLGEPLLPGALALTQGLSTLLIDGSARPGAGESVDAFVERAVRGVADVS